MLPPAPRTPPHREYLNQLCKSKQHGARISSYYAWSFMDNFEVRGGEWAG